MYTIYALIDPRDNTTRYVGMTGDIYTRLAQHIRGETGTPGKNAWMQELKDANLIVGMVNLEQIADLEYAREREVYWIFHFMALKSPLLNQHLPLLDKHKQSVARVVAVTAPTRRKAKVPQGTPAKSILRGEARMRIKMAMLRMMRDGNEKKIKYQAIADAAQTGYSTVKLYAKDLQEEIARELGTSL